LETPPSNPPYRTLTAEEFARLPKAEFCDVMESILSDPDRNENLIRMMAASEGDNLEDSVKNLKRIVEAMRYFGS
jgi:hypothetical protein